MKMLGLIGCGDVAFRTYIPGILADAARATVVATFDPMLERAQAAAAKFPNATAYSEFEPFLNHAGLDAVFNLTPAPLHAEVTGTAFDHGLHVFSEKPIAATVAEGQALAKRAKDEGLVYLCAPATMATDRFQWIKRFLDEGRMGTPTVAVGQMANLGPANWRQYTGDPSVFYRKGVGPILDIGVYVLHGITGLFGPAKRVQSFAGITIPERTVLIPRLQGEKISVETPDVSMIQLDFGNNSYAQVLSSFAVPGSQAPAMEVHCSDASLTIWLEDWYNAAGPIDYFQRDPSPAGLAGWQKRVGPPSPIGHPNENLIWSGPRHFVSVLNGTQDPILTAEHAIHILEIILSSAESATSGKAIALNTSF
ncbi:MAG: Gfo/Idh/MocA family oxidoreductase [Thermomicrobiales bacterium]